jgi:hypothetical protein
VIALSPRFAVAAATLLLCAAPPVWLHAIVAPVHDDCAAPEAFFGSGRIAGAAVEPVELAKGAVTGAEGELARPGRPPFSVRVLRTFDPVRLYSRPSSYGIRSELYLSAAKTRRLPVGDDVLPVHWRTHRWSDRIEFEAYALSQGGMPVWHPLRSGLALAGEQLLSGTRPVDVFIVSGAGNLEDFETIRGEAEGWLARTWLALEAACRP